MNRSSIANDPEALLGRSWELLQQAEYVLIGAGAGLSVDAGVDYIDPVFFARHFPAMVHRGYHALYQAMGVHPEWSEALQWGYHAAHINVIRFQTPPHEVYTSLFRLVEQKEHFVITSNVDGMFVKGGFAEKRVFTPQGDYARYQCLTPCTTETWPVAPVIEHILPTIDPATQEITDLTAIPRCPRCGGPVFANVRGGPWFVEEPHLEQEQRFTDWVTASSEKRLVILEIGAGFNTPGVIRWPLEQITHTFDETHLIRVNLDYPEVPRVLATKATSLCMRGRDVIHAFTALQQTATGEGGMGNVQTYAD